LADKDNFVVRGKLAGFEQMLQVSPFFFPHGKNPAFLFQFSCNRNRQPTIKVDVDLEVLFIYRLIPRKSGFRESTGFFDTTPISRFLRASFSVHGGIQHESACFWVSVDRYALYSGTCEI
jgi:hypothetical protein